MNLNDTFNNAASPMSEAEKALTQWHIPFKKLPDGTIVVEGSLDISHRQLERLPDLTKVHVKGEFRCNENKLTSLEGAPVFVGGSFICHTNQLTSLKGAPKEIHGEFSCFANNLETLEGGPQYVETNYDCSYNRLETLKGAPRFVGGYFLCTNNQLKKMFYAPETVGEFVLAHGNPLLSLDGLAGVKGTINSHLGNFLSWDKVPEILQIDPESWQAALADAAKQFGRGLPRAVKIRKIVKINSKAQGER